MCWLWQWSCYWTLTMWTWAHSFSFGALSEPICTKRGFRDLSFQVSSASTHIGPVEIWSLLSWILMWCLNSQQSCDRSPNWSSFLKANSLSMCSACFILIFLLMITLTTSEVGLYNQCDKLKAALFWLIAAPFWWWPLRTWTLPLHRNLDAPASFPTFIMKPVSPVI